MATTMVQEGNVIKYQNSGGAISSGDVIVIGNRIAVALVDIAATTGTGAASLVGVWRFDKTTSEGDLTQGTVMFWNASCWIPFVLLLFLVSNAFTKLS